GTLLVYEGNTHARHAEPVSTRGGGGESLLVRIHIFAIPIAQLQVRDVVFLGISIFDITNRTFDAAYVASDAFIALAAHGGRSGPLDCSTFADFVLPRAADFVEVVGEDEGGA